MAPLSYLTSRSGRPVRLQTIQATHFLVGAVAHPWTGNDFYAYYGQEQNNANAWTRQWDPGRLGQFGVHQ